MGKVQESCLIKGKLGRRRKYTRRASKTIKGRPTLRHSMLGKERHLNFNNFGTFFHYENDEIEQQKLGN